MRICVLLLFSVGCWGEQWNAIDNAKKTFQEHLVTARDTISYIENILDTSKTQTELFLEKTFSNNSVLDRVIGMRFSKDKCFAKFLDKEKLKFSFQIQVYQLQVPLQNRVVDIRERLNNINFSFDIYQQLADSKYRSCKTIKRNCLEETNQWLQSKINSLSIYPNPLDHSISKRSTCSIGQFICNNGQCITGRYFCDSECDCRDCSDEPPSCVKNCSGFRCEYNFRCVSNTTKCDGNNDCGDGTDEDGCPANTATSYTHVNCSIDKGDFLCDNEICIGLERVCDGYNDCGDWSDEGNCSNTQCSPECSIKGGVCFTDPKGSKCLYECPPGTYETSKGCSRYPEAPLPSLFQVLEDTPRLTKRYAARLKFLKTKTILELSSALREVVKCKKEEFTLLSKVIDFTTNIHKEDSPSIGAKVYPEIPREPVDVIASNAGTLSSSTEETQSTPFTEVTYY